MKCPRCQQDNPSHAKFCLECGVPFSGKNGASPGSYTDLQRALAEALEQQAATEEILRVISRSPTDLQPVLDTIARSAVRVCGATDALVSIREGDESVTAAHYGDQEVVALGQRRPIIRGLVVGRALLEARTVQVEDITETDEFPEGRAIAIRMGHRTVMAVPLLRNGAAIGAILIRRTEIRPFTARQIQVLETFASQAVIAIENVRLFTELQASNRDLTQALDQQTATSEILRVISSSPTDLQPVMAAIVETAARLADAEHALIGRAEGNVIRWLATYGTTLATSTGQPITRSLPTGRAILDRQTTQIEDVANVAREFPETVGRAYREHGVRTILATPLLREGAAVGVLLLRRTVVQPFTDKQIALLQTFADQAVIAIENVRLFKELQASNRELTDALDRQTATSEILGVISRSPTDIQPVLDAVAESATRLCSAHDTIIFRLDGDTLQRVAHCGPIPAPAGFAIPASRSRVTGRAVLDGQPIQVTDAQAKSEEFPETEFFAREHGFRTILSVPLLREGIGIGTIDLRRTEVRPFTETQIALLQTFADQAVIAIENVRLFTELQEKNRALTQAHAQVSEALEQQTATSEILRVISSSPTNLEPVAQVIADSAARLCDSTFTAVFRFDGEQLHWVAARGTSRAQEGALRDAWPRPPGRETLVGRTILARETIHIHDASSDPIYTAPTLRPAAGVRARAALAIRSFLGVPMLRDGQPIGVISVARSTVRPFSEQEIALIQTFADQAVIAVENVRLFTQLQEKNRALTQAHAQVTESLEQQTTTSEILRVISSSPTDVQPVFDTIAASASRLCGGVAAIVTRFDGEMIHLVGHHNPRPGIEPITARLYPRRPGRDTTVARAILECSIVHIPDAEKDPDLAPNLARDVRAGSFLAVPMLRDGRPIGAISVSRVETGAFLAGQVELLKTFADQAVIAIENVRLFTELEARTQDLTRSVGELRALGEVGQAISSTLDLQTVLQTIVGRATQLAGVDAGVIYEYDQQGEIFVPRATERLEAAIVETLIAAPVRKGEGVTGRLADAHEPIQLSDILEAPPESRVRDTLGRAGYRALLAVPLVREDHLLGGLTVFRKTPGEFSLEVIELLQTFATQSALAIQNARLFQEIADKGRQLEAVSQHKSEFLANMSHELRTPLNAIIGFSEVLSERMFGELNEKQEEYLKDIHASGQHLLSLINDILDLSKIEAGRMELELSDFNLPATLDNALTLVRERAGRRGIALGLTVDERLEQIHADERKVRQVVLNLLSNAIKFTPEGGRIDVRAVPVDGSVEVSVSDTGVGIAPEDQEAIFEEFRQVGTAAKKVEGTGLGLALSRKFVELHGGRIWVESELGVGSTFTFRIPVRRGE